MMLIRKEFLAPKIARSRSVADLEELVEKDFVPIL